MPAQLDAPGLVPSPSYWPDPPPWAGGQGVLFWFVFPPPHFFFFHFPFCLLVWHWGWGLLQLAGFQTFRQIAP